MAIDNLGSEVTINYSAATAYFDNVLSVDWGGISREAIETTTSSTTGGKTFKNPKHYNPGEVSIQHTFDPTADHPILASASGTLSVFFQSATTTGEWRGAVVVTGFEISAPLEDRQTGTTTFQVDGSITVS